MRDLQSPRSMYLKAILLFVIAMTGGGLLLLQDPTWGTLFLIVITCWAACRVYYFSFYVIERYIDPGFKFSGLISLLQHFLRKH